MPYVSFLNYHNISFFENLFLMRGTPLLFYKILFVKSNFVFLDVQRLKVTYTVFYENVPCDTNETVGDLSCHSRNATNIPFLRYITKPFYAAVLTLLLNNIFHPATSLSIYNMSVSSSFMSAAISSNILCSSYL